MVTAYRALTPMAVELKKVHQYIKSVYKGNNEVAVTNSYFFRDISNMKMEWEILEDGKSIEKGAIENVNVLPQETQSFTIPVKAKIKSGKEYFLNLSYKMKTAEPFLEKGYEIAYEQFTYAGAPVASITTDSKGEIIVKKEASSLSLQGKNFTLSFDTEKGILSTYKLNGSIVLENGPQPGFYRAPSDNDIGAGLNQSLRNWRNVYATTALTDVKTILLAPNTYQVVFTKNILNGSAQTEQTFTVYADGNIKVQNNIKVNKGKEKSLMRIGNNLQVNKQFNNIKWYGRGPWENYWDRKYASSVGQYQQTLSQQYFSYARPQESGNKTDVRWMTLTNAKGAGIKIEFADSLLSMSAIPYSVEDLDPAPEKHQYHSGELEQRDRIYMHVDLLQLGVQGIDSWGSMPLKKYWINPGEYNYSYWIKPIK